MRILEYIDKNNDGGFRCYGTRKFSLDEHITETVANENSDTDVIPINTKGVFAEDDQRQMKTVLIKNEIINNCAKSPLFTYFLDGSRRTFKVDDIAIGPMICPIVAGQIIVGCCQRKNRDEFKSVTLKRQCLISVPRQFHTKTYIKHADYARSYCEELNDYLRKNNRYVATHNVEISDLLFYETDGKAIKDPTDKNKLRNSAIAQIQNRMTDIEQELVNELCKSKKLNDENWLIKDGSIEYNPRFSTSRSSDPAQWLNKMRENYTHVVGVSKSFDPELIRDYEKKSLAQTIAELKPFCRTKAYKYTSAHSNGITFAVWYLRIRKEDNFRETRFSDVVKCEMVMFDPSEPIPTDTIDTISANLIREAYPVCFGADARWGNHIYPVYLTETFCKSNYIDGNIFLNLF